MHVIFSAGMALSSSNGQGASDSVDWSGRPWHMGYKTLVATLVELLTGMFIRQQAQMVDSQMVSSGADVEGMYQPPGHACTARPPTIAARVRADIRHLDGDLERVGVGRVRQKNGRCGHNAVRHDRRKGCRGIPGAQRLFAPSTLSYYTRGEPVSSG